MNKKQILKRKIREKLRLTIDRENRKNLINKDFSLICSNCTAGVIYHDLGLEFLSPTINMFMNAKDFIKFCGDIKKYINYDLVSVETTEYSYPVMKCDDITLYCVHYKDEEEVRKKWKIRGARINWDNIFIMMTERDGCDYNDILRFDKLPFERKVIFVHKDMPEVKSAIWIPGTELDGKNGQFVSDMTSYVGKLSGKRNIDKFDFIDFFNTGAIRLN